MSAPAGRAAVLGLAIVLAGCRGAPRLDPPRIHYGEDTCAHCGMIVSEERFAAAALVERDGRIESLVFDDPGCLLAHEAVAGAEAPLRRFVHDLDSLAWLDAEHAHFVRSASLTTPMLSGLGAFGSRKAAEAGAARYRGAILALAELRAEGS